MNNILIIVAHPDDEVLGCGATIAKHTDKGDKVSIVFLADGVSSRIQQKESIKQRHQATYKALDILNCEKPIFLNFPDNKLDGVILLDVVQKLEAIIYNIKPNIIYTHHYGDLNIDHQITHKAVMTVARPQPSFCVKEIYSFEILSATHWQSHSMRGFFNPNYFIDIGNFIDKKIQALKCYDKEMRTYPHAKSYQAIKSLAIFRGTTVGIKYAEAFCVEKLIK